MNLTYGVVRDLLLGMGEKKVTISEYTCERCGHEWRPRLRAQKPRTCPSCKSPYWDRPAKEKKAKSGH